MRLALAAVTVLLVVAACGKGDKDDPATDESAKGERAEAKAEAAETADKAADDKAVDTKPPPEKTKDQPPPAADDSARDAWDQFAKAVADGDAEGVWSALSDASVDEALNGSMARFIASVPQLPDDKLAPIAAAAGTTAEKIRAMDPTELAKTVMLAEAAKNRDEIVGATWKSETIADRFSVVVTESPEGETKWAFVKQSDGWRLDGPRTARLRAPPPPVPPPRAP